MRKEKMRRRWKKKSIRAHAIITALLSAPSFSAVLCLRARSSFLWDPPTPRLPHSPAPLCIATRRGRKAVRRLVSGEYKVSNSYC
jgi:hypothetical protein